MTFRKIKNTVIVSLQLLTVIELQLHKNAENIYIEMQKMYPWRNKCAIITITKTRLYSFDPLKPQFYTVKLQFTEVYIIFLIFDKNIDCGYSLHRLAGRF